MNDIISNFLYSSLVSHKIYLARFDTLCNELKELTANKDVRRRGRFCAPFPLAPPRMSL